MRIDQFLAVSRLVRPRQRAKRACEAGIVLLNGLVAKPAKSVSVGDELVVSLVDRTLLVEVASIPSNARPLPQARARELYEFVDGGDPHQAAARPETQ